MGETPPSGCPISTSAGLRIGFVEVRQEYSLTIDQAEVDALDAIFQGCTSFDMIVTERESEQTFHPCDTNRNGKIDLVEAIEVIRLYFQGLGS